MSAASIAAKVKAGLAKAAAAVGSPADAKIYLVRKTQGGTPLAPSTTETIILLPNAIFKSYQQGLTDINIRAGDRQLVSDSDNEINQNDIIRQGTTDYIVISVDKKAPATQPLAYISQIRVQ